MISLMKNILRKATKVRTDRTIKKLNAEDKNLLRSIRAKKLTYLSEKKLANILTSCSGIERCNVKGLFIEAGCALGGSTILIAKTKNTERPLYVYDVFEMIPPPSEQDTKDVHERYETIAKGDSEGIGGDIYYGYQENLLDKVKENMRAFNIDFKREKIQLVKGLVQDTMHIDESVAFAHIDVDWYEPVLTCLERIFPNLAKGGAIILDDYNDWGGCKKATDEYLEKVKGQFLLETHGGSLKVIKL